MRGFKAPAIELSKKIIEILKNFAASYPLPSCIVLRSRLLLMATEGESSTKTAQILGFSRNIVNTWRKYFHENTGLLLQTEEACRSSDNMEDLPRLVKSFLSDKPRLGKPPVFTPEETMFINEPACRDPKDFGHGLSHWNLTSLAQEAVRQKIVTSISPASVHRFLKFGGIEPWKNRYWLNSPEKHDDLETFKKLKPYAICILKHAVIQNTA